MKSGNIDHLMIVDAMAKYLEPERLYKSKRTEVKRLTHGMHISEATQVCEEASDLKPTAVTIIVGSNDLWNKSTSATITEMKKMINSATKVFKNSKLLVSEIMPRPYPKSFNKKAIEVNKALHLWKTTIPQLIVIRHQRMWEDISLFEKDNFHLTETEGTAALVTQLEPCPRSTV